MVDKNLFLHDLSVVAILKCEGAYLKEWLDYHLLAGVEHFYLYDNDSPDNQRKVAEPYIAAGIVDYFHAPGKVMQLVAYNDAVKRFKFQSRYMAFIDGDEFIFPKVAVGEGYSIVDVVDEILSHDTNAGGLSVNWQSFGSNGQETADYSRGVLERFTRRAPKDWMPPKDMGNAHVKSIANPRRINTTDPHTMIYFEGNYPINEVGDITPGSISQYVTAEKIVVNHYHCKSWEEYSKRVERGDAFFNRKTMKYTRQFFDRRNRNDEFDDGILRYRAARAKKFRPPDFAHADERLLNALIKNLSPTLVPSTTPKFYRGKIETFLTCRAVAAYLQSRLTDATPAKFFEEAALKAMLPSLDGMSFADARLFLRELPKLLSLPYPAVKDLRQAAIGIIPQLMDILHLNNVWREYVELDSMKDLLKLIKEE